LILLDFKFLAVGYGQDKDYHHSPLDNVKKDGKAYGDKNKMGITTTAQQTALKKTRKP